MLGKRLLMYVKPTEQCNTQCLHCYNTNKNATILDVVKYRKFLDSVAKSIGDRQVEVVLHGGEPTLVGSTMLERIILETKAALPFSDVQFSIQTNLLEYDDYIARIVTKYTDGIVGTSYSPYIRFLTSNEYAMWLGNLKMAVYQGLKPYLIITLSKKYIETVKPQELIDFLTTENIWGFHFEPLTRDGLATENWNDIKPDPVQYDLWKTDFADLFIKHHIYNIIEKSDIVNKSRVFIDGGFVGCCTRSCYMSVLTINSNGTIGGCPNRSLVQRYGDLDDDFETILQSPVRREQILRERVRRAECLACDVFKHCNGGCIQTDDCFEGKHFYRLLHERFCIDHAFNKFVTEYHGECVHV